jgi:DNA sulfur modification protein DndE
MTMTVSTVNRLSVAEIGRIDFRTSRPGDTATNSLLKALGLTYRYQPARLALGRSLGLTTQPPAAENLDGKPIRGETLLGQSGEDVAMWVSLITRHAGRGPLDRRTLQELLAAHWARGANLLWDSLRGVEDPLAALSNQALKARK